MGKRLITITVCVVLIGVFLAVGSVSVGEYLDFAQRREGVVNELQSQFNAILVMVKAEKKRFYGQYQDHEDWELLEEIWTSSHVDMCKRDVESGIFRVESVGFWNYVGSEMKHRKSKLMVYRDNTTNRLNELLKEVEASFSKAENFLETKRNYQEMICAVEKRLCLAKSKLKTMERNGAKKLISGELNLSSWGEAERSLKDAQRILFQAIIQVKVGGEKVNYLEVYEYIEGAKMIISNLEKEITVIESQVNWLKSLETESDGD
ncbi:hypothetical protein ACFL08_04155 [Patescibacteria group bacterium]